MDRVFPENMNPVNAGDTIAAISTIDSYVRYMRERIEYAVNVLTKLNSGTSLADLASRMSNLELRVGELNAQISSLNTRVTQLENE